MSPRTELEATLLGADPFENFLKWFDEARNTSILQPEAMSLATSTSDGHPSVRTVLFKGLHPKTRGFLFYTNYESRKSQDLIANPHAALSFHWSALDRQIRIEGQVTKTTRAESETYFASRPRGSQLGAWASHQSARISGHSELEKRYQELEKEYEGREIPCPPHWGGWVLSPTRIEFWIGQTRRLHERVLFTLLSSGAWAREELAP